MDPAKLVGALAPLFVFACSSSAATGGDDAFTCLGVRPPAAAYGASPSPLRTIDGGGPLLADGGCSGAGCPGASLPMWALNDFQPNSCGHGATYGLDAFRGRAVLVGLWAGW